MMQTTMAEMVTTSVLGAPPVGPSAPITGPNGGGGGGGAPAGGPDFTFIMLAMLGVFVLMMILSGGAAKKEKRKRAEMMASLGKHDRVQTSGGVIGTVVELKDDEVVLRVDESTNTRIRFAKSSITSVLRRGKGAEADVEEAASE